MLPPPKVIQVGGHRQSCVFDSVWIVLCWTRRPQETPVLSPSKRNRQHRSSNSSNGTLRVVFENVTNGHTSSSCRAVAPRCPLACQSNPNLGSSAPTVRFVRMLASDACGVCFSVQSSVACLVVNQLMLYWYR